MPAGSLAALAVVLAALAVVVVAGARDRIVHVPSGSIQRTPTAPVGPRHHHHTGVRHHAATRTVGTVTSRSATGAGSEPSGAVVPLATSTTTIPTSPSSTTTTTSTTTTLPAVASLLHRKGTFRDGNTVADVPLNAVQTVTVEVPAGIRVSLTVSCVGVQYETSTSTTWASVHFATPANSCTAKIVVPDATPEPAAWLLSAT
jgi:hypothetical protein